MKEQMPIAARFAVDKHEGQMYGDKPYAYHLWHVDQLIVKAFKPVNLDPGQPYSDKPGSEIDKLRAIAFLHDVLEDTDATVTDLLDLGLCEEVVRAVVAITKYPDESYNKYIQGVLDNPLAHKVKIADTCTNLAHSLLENNEKRIKKYKRQLSLLKGFEKLDEQE